MTTIQTRIWGETHTVEMDAANASGRVFFCGEGTQYQTADFRHNIYDALRKHLEAVASESGDVNEAEIDAAIERAEEVDNVEDGDDE